MTRFFLPVGVVDMDGIVYHWYCCCCCTASVKRGSTLGYVKLLCYQYMAIRKNNSKRLCRIIMHVFLRWSAYYTEHAALSRVSWVIQRRLSLVLHSTMSSWWKHSVDMFYRIWAHSIQRDKWALKVKWCICGKILVWPVHKFRNQWTSLVVFKDIWLIRPQHYDSLPETWTLKGWQKEKKKACESFFPVMKSLSEVSRISKRPQQQGLSFITSAKAVTVEKGHYIYFYS